MKSLKVDFHEGKMILINLPEGKKSVAGDNEIQNSRVLMNSDEEREDGWKNGKKFSHFMIIWNIKREAEGMRQNSMTRVWSMTRNECFPLPAVPSGSPHFPLSSIFLLLFTSYPQETEKIQKNVFFYLVIIKEIRKCRTFRRIIKGWSKRNRRTEWKNQR